MKLIGKLKSRIQTAIASMVRAAMKKQGLTEKEILKDFKQHRKSRRRR